MSEAFSFYLVFLRERRGSGGAVGALAVVVVL